MIDLEKERETTHNAINTLFDIAKVQKAEIDLLNVDIANKQSEINELKAKLEVAQVPEGFVLVPKEPTERMLDSAYSSISDNLHYADLENIYKAMIRAAQGEEE